MGALLCFLGSGFSKGWETPGPGQVCQQSPGILESSALLFEGSVLAARTERAAQGPCGWSTRENCSGTARKVLWEDFEGKADSWSWRKVPGSGGRSW